MTGWWINCKVLVSLSNDSVISVFTGSCSSEPTRLHYFALFHNNIPSKSSFYCKHNDINLILSEATFQNKMQNKFFVCLFVFCFIKPLKKSIRNLEMGILKTDMSDQYHTDVASFLNSHNLEKKKHSIQIRLTS